MSICFGWYFDSVKWYANGYSPLSFMGLYLLARYIRLYSNYDSISKIYYLSLYIVCSIIIALISYTGLFSISSVYSYNCPIVILSSVCLFLFFTKMTIKSNLINSIAKWSIICIIIRFHLLNFSRILIIIYLII